MSLSEAGETYHHLPTALDLEYLTQTQFDEIEAQLEPLRGGIAALLFKVRPPRRERKQTSPRPQGAASPRRSRGQSGALARRRHFYPASAGASSVSGAFGASHSLPHFMHLR